MGKYIKTATRKRGDYKYYAELDQLLTGARGSLAQARKRLRSVHGTRSKYSRRVVATIHAVDKLRSDLGAEFERDCRGAL